jgi:aminomethyltransferase
VTAVQSTPLAGQHAALSAHFGEFAGWRMPLWYGGAVGEHLAVRKAAGVFDVSHMGRFGVEGKDAAALLSASFSRDAASLAPAASGYALACNAAGGIIDDLIVYRLDAARFRVICNAANAGRIGALLEASRSTWPAVAVADSLAGTVLIAVQGPQAVAAVAALVPGAAAIGRRGCGEVALGGATCFLARTGYTGEDGFEIMLAAAAGEALFERLLAAGVTPCGLAARDSLRLEAALPLYGVDMDDATSPWEAGLGWALALEHDFPGRDALIASKAAARRRLTCIVGDGQGVFRSHQLVYHDEEPVGQVSSGGFSPLLERSIAMAYLPRALAPVGTALTIDIRGRRVAAHTVKRPFYTSSRAGAAP